ncbi:hypothetical protein ACGGZK_17800 [Agromyces sp. MMS24-K17]|uniref:hypothetical protein n=1 Tax=Agromyces sp. MMS24-K17 TaxID=3372850 RepID=UPI0037549F6A
MRTTAGPVAFDAVDHELVRVHERADAPRPAFADAYVSTEPTWRLVAGYLMVAARDGVAARDAPARLGVHSHGRRVADLVVEDDVVRVASDRPFSLVGGAIHGDGIALAPGEGTAWRLAADGREVEVTRAAGWSFAIVHGPAEVKVANRLRLLASLDRVGGRRG